LSGGDKVDKDIASTGVCLFLLLLCFTDAIEIINSTVVSMNKVDYTKLTDIERMQTK